MCYFYVYVCLINCCLVVLVCGIEIISFFNILLPKKVMFVLKNKIFSSYRYLNRHEKQSREE